MRCVRQQRLVSSAGSSGAGQQIEEIHRLDRAGNYG